MDAKFHIRNDLSSGSLNNAAGAAMEYTMERARQDKLLMYHVLEDHALGKLADALFLEYEGRSWTYKQFYDDLQRVGNWLMKDLGIAKGEMVAV